MHRPIIIAICGKSATGKSSLARWLIKEFNKRQIPANLIISDTTRPPREGEKDGIDYNFLSLGVFLDYKNKGKYLEDSCFRQWRYGTRISSIDRDKINIGIFNAEGIESLKQYVNKYNIIPVYLEETLIERLRRSYQRESCWKTEYFRRAFVDWKDFFYIDIDLKYFFHWLKFSDENNIASVGRRICYYLERIKLIESGQNSVI